MTSSWKDPIRALALRSRRVFFRCFLFSASIDFSCFLVSSEENLSPLRPSLGKAFFPATRLLLYFFFIPGDPTPFLFSCIGDTVKENRGSTGSNGVAWSLPSSPLPSAKNDESELPC